MVPTVRHTAFVDQSRLGLCINLAVLIMEIKLAPHFSVFSQSLSLKCKHTNASRWNWQCPDIPITLVVYVKTVTSLEMVTPNIIRLVRLRAFLPYRIYYRWFFTRSRIPQTLLFRTKRTQLVRSLAPTLQPDHRVL